MIWNYVQYLWGKMTPGPKETPKHRDYFDDCFEFVMKWEGGSKLHEVKDDPGGLTKYGISKRANPDIDIASLTEDEAKQIYRSRYWGKCGADIAQWPLNLVLFDTAVNCGVAITKKWNNNPAGTPQGRAYAMLDKREHYYSTLVEKKPKMRKFLKGWLNRTNDLRRRCI